MIVPPLPASDRADHRRSIPRLESTAVGRLGAKATQHKKRDELMGDAAADVDRQKRGEEEEWSAERKMRGRASGDDGDNLGTVFTAKRDLFWATPPRPV